MTPELMALTPQAPDWLIDWVSIWALWPEQMGALDGCPQCPEYHAEGDVGRHTRMVGEALVADPAWRALPDDRRAGLFWAAVLHDIGKPAVTRVEDGRITSRGHSRVGAQIARGLLWRAGVSFAWREAVCGLIAAHQLPFWLIERPDPARLAIETSWRCRASDLLIHARADAMGRICRDQTSILEAVDLARVVFEEAECLHSPRVFANDESRVAYFEREDRDPSYPAHEDPRCTVTIMSGLPGAGKDTWIAAHAADRPVVSLDAIRAEIGAAPTGDQGRVIQMATEMAKGHLRSGQDFIWNGTNVTRQVRRKVIRVCSDYGARVEVVYLEPSWEKLRKQNRGRSAMVPEAAWSRLAEKFEPPDETEVHRVLRFVATE